MVIQSELPKDITAWDICPVPRIKLRINLTGDNKFNHKTIIGINTPHGVFSITRCFT